MTRSGAGFRIGCGWRALMSELPAEVRSGVYVIVPAYNEARVLGEVVERLRRSYPQIVVVDDGSRDATFEVARRAGAMALRHPINRGQGAAIQTGIEFALRRGAEYLVTFDADGQHQVEDVDRLVDPIRRGECDICLGSRFLGEALNLPTSRKWLLRAAVLFTRVTSGANLTDTHNGLRAFSRRAAERLDITLDGMAHASEIIDQVVRSGLTYREVPVQIHYTDYSLAKGQTSRGAFRVLLQYVIGRVTR